MVCKSKIVVGTKVENLTSTGFDIHALGIIDNSLNLEGSSLLRLIENSATDLLEGRERFLLC